MTSIEKRYITEWNRIVNAAHLQLTGTCPLLEDEVIIWVNDIVQSTFQRMTLDEVI